ncbi:MAG: hypothetical protein RSA27_07770, partial [Oscillospiraceae bacterium]
MQIKRVKISLLCIPIVLASVYGGYFLFLAIAYTCALIHEFAHIGVAKSLNVKIAKIEILPFGICGKLENNLIKNPAHEILIALAGPLSNLLILALIFLWTRYMPILNSDIISYLIHVNIAMMAINLIPSLPLDGGRILKAILTMALGGIKAYNIMMRVSRVLIFLILLSACVILVTTHFNFSLILIGAFMLGNLTNEQRNISLISMKEIAYADEKLLKEEPNHVAYLAAHENVYARRVMRKFTY